MNDINDILQQNSVEAMVPEIIHYFHAHLGLKVTVFEFESSKERNIGIEYKLNAARTPLDTDDLLALLHTHFRQVLIIPAQDLNIMLGKFKTLMDASCKQTQESPKANITFCFACGLFLAVRLNIEIEQRIQELSNPKLTNAELVTTLNKLNELMSELNLKEINRLHDALNNKLDTLLAKQQNLTEADVHVKELIKTQLNTLEDYIQLSINESSIKLALIDLFSIYEEHLNGNISDLQKTKKLALTHELKRYCQRDDIRLEVIRNVMQDNKQLLTSDSVGQYLYNVFCYLFGLTNKRANYGLKLFNVRVGEPEVPTEETKLLSPTDKRY